MRCRYPIKKKISTGSKDTTKRVNAILREMYGQQMEDRKDLEFVPCNRCDVCCNKNRAAWNAKLHYQSLSEEDKPVTHIFMNYEDEKKRRLRLQDLRDFVKELRMISRKSFAYFGIGSYASSDDDPHYHLMVFGIDWNMDKMSILHRKGKGDDPRVWTHEIISKLLHKCGGMRGGITINHDYARLGNYIMSQKTSKEDNYNVIMMENEEELAKALLEDNVDIDIFNNKKLRRVNSDFVTKLVHSRGLGWKNFYYGYKDKNGKYVFPMLEYKELGGFYNNQGRLCNIPFDWVKKLVEMGDEFFEEVYINTLSEVDNLDLNKAMLEMKENITREDINKLQKK